MITLVRRALVVLSIMALILGTGGLSHADPITGSLPLAGFGTVLDDGTNLSNTTSVSSTDTLTTSPGLDAPPLPPPFGFSDIPALQSFGPNTVDLTNFIGFVLSNANYGTFTSTSGLIVQQLNNFLDVFYLGTFTPGPLLDPLLEPNTASLRISFNQSGASLSQAITLNAPALDIPISGVPEPSTWLLLATGTLGLLGYGWRRQRKA